MESRDFCYWLQGFMEISGAKELNTEQLQVINDHLKLVFDKQTPIYNYSPLAAGIGSTCSIPTSALTGFSTQC